MTLPKFWLAERDGTAGLSGQDFMFGLVSQKKFDALKAKYELALETIRVLALANRALERLLLRK
jgi:hypothetical protein